MKTPKSIKRRKWYYISGSALIPVLIFIFFFSGKKEKKIQVQTESVEYRDITQTVAVTGQIMPEEQVVITSEVTGEIVVLPVKEGDQVKKGDLLIKIKPDMYLAQKERAVATLTGTKANLRMQKAQLEMARLDYNREKELFDKGLSSNQSLEQINTELTSEQARYEAQQAQVLQAEAALKEAEESLAKTAIYAPMSGTISQMNVELGEKVLGSGYSQGTHIMTVADLSLMEANVDIDENDVILVSITDTAVIEIDAIANQTFKGVVTQIGNSARRLGEGTQNEVVNFEVKIRILDLDPRIRPGMSCNADIETETKIHVLAAPIQSVTTRTVPPKGNSDTLTPENLKNGNGKQLQPREIVFVVENGLAHIKPVKSGISDDNFLEIIEGLNEGEMIVSGSYQAIAKQLEESSMVAPQDKTNPPLAHP